MALVVSLRLQDTTYYTGGTEMRENAKKVVFPKTRRSNLPGASYITQMLRQLKEQADEIDWQLAYMIEMAATHSMDIDVGSYKAETARQATALRS